MARLGQTHENGLISLPSRFFTNVETRNFASLHSLNFNSGQTNVLIENGTKFQLNTFVVALSSLKRYYEPDTESLLLFT